ncbi:catechol 2,3-dioxygenase-like lactoylglutathione lyase family enzyme [Sphingomonas sp. F9_3S_D5_B_2]|jgi:catechol 2,3-dioxygenase-like lactoylglutathione lyase family enzyme
MGVHGIGGLFFRARDPEALTAWYREHLNVGAGCVAPGASAGEPDAWSWITTGGPVVFAPFAADTNHFPADKAFMLNLRVGDLPALIEQLNGQGIEVTTNAEWDHPDVGRFARICDPEGNPIELWEPPATGG